MSALFLAFSEEEEELDEAIIDGLELNVCQNMHINTDIYLRKDKNNYMKRI